MSQEIAQAWQADYDRAIKRITDGPGWGVGDRSKLQGLTGLEALQLGIKGEGPAPMIGQTLDFILVSVAPGEAIFQGAPQLKHLNPMGGIHGGWYATLLDSAVGCAIHTLMPAGRGYTTAELSINIVKAVKPGMGQIRAIGKALHCGRQLATAEGKLVGPDGTLYAHATTTCLVFEMPPAK